MTARDATAVAARTRPRLVLADDHTLFAAGVRALLEPACEVIAMVSDGEALLEATRRLRPDLVITDVSMPLCNGIDAIRRIRQQQPQIRIICLTMHVDRMYQAEAMDAGADGFVVKHAAADELRQAVRAVMQGRSFVSSMLGGGAEEEHGPRGRHAAFQLTERRRQVLQLVAEGHTVREIAARLKLAPKTVEFHKYQIARQLGLSTTAELIQFAIKHGLVSEPLGGGLPAHAGRPTHQDKS